MNRTLLVRLAPFALVACVAALYAPVLDYAFVRFDDPEYVTNNPFVATGLSLENVSRAWTAFHSSNWHPLTWMSHQLDVSLFGLDAGAHHGVNAALHALNAVLCFLFLKSATGRVGPSVFVAAAFAVHPLRVQSVAWISERKDLLSAACFFLALLAWLRYARRPSSTRYLLALCACGAGLLAKPSVVPLPLVLLLVDLWPLERHRGPEARSLGALFLEKLPFLGLAVASTVVTVLAQDASGALSTLDEFSWSTRLATAASAPLLYVAHTAVPLGLAYFYPHPAITDPASWSPLGALALAGGLAVLAGGAASTLTLLRGAGSSPEARAASGADRPGAAIATGWLWFLLTLAPMAGLVQVGEQLWADRYAYLSTVGLLIAVAFPLARFRFAPFVGALALAGWSAGTVLALPAWKDSRSLFERALETTQRNYMAHAGLANVLREEGAIEPAREQYEAALAIYPEFPEALFNLGLLEQEAGRPARAEELYRASLAIVPDNADAHLNLAAVLAQAGRLQEALESLAAVLSLDPSHPLALQNLRGLHSAARQPGAPAELRSLRPRLQELLRPQRPNSFP